MLVKTNLQKLNVADALLRMDEEGGSSQEQLCDAYDCNELATETIGVGAGEFGIIELVVCKNCISKFQGDSI